MSSIRQVIAYAKRHGGVITTREILELGMPKSTLNRRVEDGILVRLGRGVLALPGTSTRPDALMRAAGRSLGAVVSHNSAARLHGMEPVPKSLPTVTVSHRGTYTFPGLSVHQSTDMRPEHVVRIEMMDVTSPERTLVDMAKVLGAAHLERLVDNSLAAGLADVEDLADLYTALTRPGKKGMKALGRVLIDRVGDEQVAQTVIETRLFSLLRKAGVSLPIRQFHAPWLEPINGRVDFAYVDAQIVVEADSRRWHLLFDAFDADRRRDIAAQLAGWIVLRFTWRMLVDEPTFVVNTVRDALTVRSADSGGS